MNEQASFNPMSQPWLRHGICVICVAILTPVLNLSVDARPVSSTASGENSLGQPAIRTAGDKAKYTSFDCTGATKTEAYDINNAGYIVGFCQVSGRDHGFLRDPQGNLTLFDPKKSIGTEAYGLDEDHSVSGYYSDGKMQHGFVRSPDGTITTFDPKGSMATEDFVMNGGYIPGDFLDKGHRSHGFLRDSSGTITTFDAADSGDTTSNDIANGVLVGTYNDGAVTHCFTRRTADGKIDIFEIENSTDSECVTIDDRGEVAGDYSDSDGNYHGFVRSKNRTVTTFDVPGALNTYVNSNGGKKGAIVGIWRLADGINHGYMRSADGKITTFDPPGSTWTSPVDNNASNAIAGLYYDSNSAVHGFLRTP